VKWLTTLEPHSLALYMVLFQPGVAGVEHYRSVLTAVCICPARGQPGLDIVGKAYGPRPPNMHIGGSPVRLSMWMVKQTGDFSATEQCLYDRSVSSADWASAATILWWRSAPTSVTSVLEAAQWHRVPIEHWIEAFKPIMDRCRRSGMAGDLISDEVYYVRKVFNVTYRSNDEADWASEDPKRNNWCVPKRMPWVRGRGQGSAAWFDQLVESSLRTARTLVQRVSSSQHVLGLEDWWKRRHHWVAGGASSIRAVMEKEFVDDRWRSGDRMSKKGVFECLPTSYAADVVYGSVPIDLARCSTKPEPGGKQRALIASDEAAYVAGSYGSVHMEKEMAFDGLLGKQLPVDTMHWLRVHNNIPGYWFSLDYSDFNSEHAKWELAVVAACNAKAWAEQGDSRVAADKVAANMWSSLCQDNAWYRRGDDWVRLTNGLNSGDRNTLRDHNYMHRAYADAAMVVARSLGFIQQPMYEGFVGDDEDRLEPSVAHAIGYHWGIKFCGHNVNPAKQLAGRQHHEFLQRMLIGPRMPVRPLAMIVATIASGNWYVEQGIWFDSAVQSTSDNFWECVCRGMPIAFARRIATLMLDQLFTLRSGPKPTKGTADRPFKEKKAEWWTFRLGNDPTRPHPLWRGTGGPVGQVPMLRSKPTARKTWPGQASKDWMEHLQPVLSQLRSSRVERYYDFLREESHGGGFHHFRQRELRTAMWDEWPVRVSGPAAEVFKAVESYTPSGTEILRLASNGTIDRKPFTREQMEGAVGIDAYLSKQVGGTLDLYARLSYDAWGRYSHIVEKPVVDERIDHMESSLRAWFTSYPYPHPLFSRMVPPSQKLTDVLLYVVAAAGSGKSWFAARRRNVVEMDVAVYQRHGWGHRYSGPTVMHWDLVAARDAIRYFQAVGGTVLVGQWPPDVIRRAYALLMPGGKLEVYGVDPGVELRRSRCLQRAGWTEEKFAKYEARWVAAKQEVPPGRIVDTWPELEMVACQFLV